MKRKTLSQSQSQQEFEERIRKLQAQIERLQKISKQGYHYEEIWVAASTIKAHKRRGYWATRATNKRPR